MSSVDIAIIGAGIAGASLGHALLARAPGLKLVLLEAEEAPGYHTTGRSAAFYAETYGGPDVQPLTTASKAFFQKPPAGFADVAILSPRGALHIAHREALDTLEALEAEFEGGGVAFQRLAPEGVLAKAPFLKPEWATTAIWEPGCADIDVAALHQAYLRGVRRMGGTLVTSAGVTAIAKAATGWTLTTPAGPFHAGRIANAAGAWGDVVAGLAGVAPIGLAPLRRTIVVAEVKPEAAADMPVIMDSGGSLYFKPDAGRLWISPHDETPDVPHDVQPDEMDMAVALDRFEQMTSFSIRRLASKWAGLRTFAPDRLPVIGPDTAEPSFFWCVGQGGWGIQTAPAAAEMGAAILLGETPCEAHERYCPSRFRVPAGIAAGSISC
jgi:D-arginine dehydrogenase